MDRDKLREALAVHDSWRRTIEKRYPNAFDLDSLSVQVILAAAARAWLDLHTECEECAGEGWQQVAGFTDKRATCPACGSRGYTLNIGKESDDG
jgi:hypothetical protein